MKLESRNFQENDYDAYIKELTKSNMQELFINNFGGWSDDVSKKRFFQTLEKGIIKLFFLDNKFVGYVSFEIEKNNPNSYLINDIHIKNQFQNKGFGKEILEFVINKAKTNKINQIKVFVFKNNKAINFYLKNNFKERDFLEKSNTSILTLDI